MGKRLKPEEIIAKLREVEVRLARSETTAQAARAIGVTEQSYYRLCKLARDCGDNPWRREYRPRLKWHIALDEGQYQAFENQRRGATER